MPRRSPQNGRIKKITAVRYRDELWRMGTALTTAVIACSGIYFLAKPEILPFFTLLGIGAIYFGMAYVALLWIRLCTVLLDKFIPWDAHRHSRAALQLFAGTLWTLVLVYGLAKVVFSMPALKVPFTEERLDEYHQGGILLTIFVSLISNLYYVCSYLLAICYRILAKAHKMLDHLRSLRSTLAKRKLEIRKLKDQLDEQAIELARKDAEMEKKIVLEAERRLKEFLTDSIEQKQPAAEIPVPEIPVPTYSFDVGGKQKEVPYPEIIKFTVLIRVVFIHWIETDNSVQNRAVKAESLKALGIKSNHYFRKVTRNTMISQDMIKNCENPGNGQYELLLKHVHETLRLSEDTSRNLKPWIEAVVKINMKPKETKGGTLVI
ncbi:hypothetical protein SAMN05216436_106139 [bacterium A37T11]|nr:hypothetical protein SAMN05216436_106139 [bacterium A37T11]